MQGIVHESILLQSIRDAVSAHSPELMLHRVWQRVVDDLNRDGASRCQSTALIEAGHGSYRVLIARGLSNQYVKQLIASSDHPVVEAVLKTGLPLDLREGHGNFQAPGWGFEHPYSQVVAVPLTVGRRVTGAAFFDTREGAPYGAEDIEMLSGVANLCGLRIDRDRTLDQYSRSLEFDPLTLTHSYRHFRESLTRELRRAEFERHTVALALVSIDHLKEYNEVFGHHRAEIALEKIASMIGSGVRSIDEVSRYGGAKYAVIMPVIGRHEAVMMIESLRSSVERLFKEKEGPSLTLSAGIGFYPAGAATEDGLLGLTEALLLESKRAHGNTVKSHT